MRRFPYNVIYMVTDQEMIFVACFHASRNPVVWKPRV
jgi:hypothetical protein